MRLPQNLRFLIYLGEMYPWVQYVQLEGLWFGREYQLVLLEEVEELHILAYELVP